MFSSVTSWLGGGTAKEENAAASSVEEKSGAEKATTENSEAADTPPEPVATGEDGKTESPSSETEESKSGWGKGEDVSKKAVDAAKEWGSYLFSVGKSATVSVVNTAKHVVEEKGILGDFKKEQDQWISENREKAKHSEAAVPPWVGYNEEETMKKQILDLSVDKRNFMRNPPAGVQFHFDFDSTFPVALATLQEDPNLQKMRFDLVPKAINEENFWRNYFYRVSLIKQSTQLTSLAQQTGSTGEGSVKSTESSRRSSEDSGSNKEKTPAREMEKGGKGEEEVVAGSPPENEFISDAFAGSQIDEEDLKREMQQLGMDDQTQAEEDEELPEWERELQQELNDYEVVVEGEDLDDADLENEILQQIEAEAKQS